MAVGATDQGPVLFFAGFIFLGTGPGNVHHTFGILCPSASFQKVGGSIEVQTGSKSEEKVAQHNTTQHNGQNSGELI